MKANETESSNSTGSTVNQARKSHSRYRYQKVLDGRKQPIRGLWQRNGKFLARISVEGDNGQTRVYWKPLEKAQTVAQAVEALKALHTDRARNQLSTLKQTPKFCDYADSYLESIKTGEGKKKPGTIAKEEGILKSWKAHLGGIRLERIKKSHVSAFIQKRLKEGCSKRTVKLDVIVLRNVLKDARDTDEHIRELPIPGTVNKDLKDEPPIRKLVTSANLETLCKSAIALKKDGAPVTKNGQQFADYLRFMAYSGTRRNEALGVQWADIDFDGEQLFVRRQVTERGIESPKSSSERVVDFNSKLRALLLDMKQRRAPDSQWVFPSPQRGEKDIPTHSFRESLELTRAHAKMPQVAFHDMRHLFISYCVMSGIDYMTIAKWVGHRDGGVLIGKVYGHLADEHKKAQAQRVNFEPIVLPSVAA